MSAQREPNGKLTKLNDLRPINHPIKHDTNEHLSSHDDHRYRAANTLARLIVIKRTTAYRWQIGSSFIYCFLTLVLVPLHVRESLKA